MKTRTNRIYKYIPLYVLDYPVFIYGILLFIFTGITWLNFGIMFLFWLASTAWQAVVTQKYNLYSYSRFYRDLCRFRHYNYQRFPLQKFLPTSVIKLLFLERLGIGLTKEPLGYICVFTRKTGQQGKPVLGGMTTYPLELTPWYITVPDKPEDFNAFQRFQLLHEIGHSMLYHKIILERKLNSPVQATLFLVIILLTSSLNLTQAFVITILLFFWCALIKNQSIAEVEYEKLADSFAILFLQENDRKEAIYHHRRNLERTLNYSEVTQRIELIEHVHSRLSENPNSVSLKQLLNEYNSYAQSLAWPQWYVYILLFPSMLLAINNVTKITFLDIFFIGVLAFPLPLLIFFLLRFTVDIYKQRVDKIMEIGEVPECFEEERSAT